MRNASMTLLVAGLLLSCGRGEAPVPRVHHVEMKGLVYAPAELTVAPRDRIMWTNRDIVPHSITADGGQFDSGSVAPSAEWAVTLRAGGRIPYTCIFHPTMKAVLIAK
jgi:plastocyanin